MHCLKGSFLLDVYNCLSSRMYMYHMHVCFFQGAEEGVRTPGSKAMDSYVFILEENPGPLQEKPMFLSVERSLQAHSSILILRKHISLVFLIWKKTILKRFLSSLIICPPLDLIFD